MIRFWTLALSALTLEVVGLLLKDVVGSAKRMQEAQETISWRRVIVQPGFGGSHGLIPMSNDFVLVADTYQKSRAIHQINASTGVLNLYLGSQQLSEPSGLVLSPDKSFIYVCDLRTRSIHMYRTADHGLQNTYSSKGTPWNVRYTANNELYYVTFEGKVWRQSSQGHVQVGDHVPHPYDLVLLSNGQLFVSSMEGALYRIDLSSGETTKAVSLNGSIPEGLDVFVDHDGREKLVVADTGLGKIYKVDPISGSVTTLLDGSSQPGFKLPINVRTLGKQVFVNAMDMSNNMLLLVGDFPVAMGDQVTVSPNGSGQSSLGIS